MSNNHGYQPKGDPNYRPPKDGPVASSNVKKANPDMTITIANVSPEVRSATQEGIMRNLSIGHVIPKSETTALLQQALLMLSAAIYPCEELAIQRDILKEEIRKHLGEKPNE